MKICLLIFALLALIPSLMYSQEALPKDELLQEEQENSFHTFEVGAGGTFKPDIHPAFNMGLSSSLNKSIASFLEFNMAYGESGVLFRELNYKMGPYLQLNEYSYIAISTGMSFMWNNPAAENTYYYRSRDQGEFILSVPVQARINIGLYSRAYFGLKGNFYKTVFDRGVDDRGTVLFYIGYGW